MKSNFSILVMLFIPFLLFSQYNEWSDPVMLTDSMSNNTSATYKTIFNNGTDMQMIFYEKSTDTASTAIYMKPDIWDTVQVEIISEPGVHFKNPQIFYFDYYWDKFNSDTLFYLFYETNINGNWDIYYLKYHYENGFSTPAVSFCNSDENEYNLCSNAYKALVYQLNDKIIYREFQEDTYSFSDALIIAEGQCHHPLIDYHHEFIVWQTGVEGNYSIDFSRYMWSSDEWSEPYTLTNFGNNVMLNISDVDAPLLIWEKQTDTVSQIYTYDFWNAPDTTYSLIDFLSGVNKYDPSILGLNIVTDESAMAGFTGIASFTTQLPCSTPVYANQYVGENLFYNVSVTPGICYNTNIFFNKFESSSYNLILTWETEHNGNRALYGSHINILLGDIETIDKKEVIELSAVPNPYHFTTELIIKTGSHQFLDLIIYDIHGNICLSKEIETNENGELSFIWDGKNESGTELREGLYFCRISNHNLIRTIKIEKSTNSYQ